MSSPTSCPGVYPLLLVLSLAVVHAVYVPVEDSPDAYPLLKNTDGGGVVRWSRGRMATLRLSSNAVRISNRGVRFIPMTMSLHSTDAWPATGCTASTTALCRTTEGVTVFPEAASDARIPGYAGKVRDSFGMAVAEQECRRFASRIIVDTDSYAITLCDITQKGFNFIVTSDTVMQLDRDGHLWFYLAVSIGTVILVTSVAQNIAHLLGETKVVTSLWLELTAALVLIGVSPFGLAFVTTGDVLYYYFTLAYIVVNILYWLWRDISSLPSLSWGSWGLTLQPSADADAAVPVNVLLGTLLLTLCRLYDGIECEYISPLLFILLTRSFHKAQGFIQTPLYLAPGAGQPPPDSVGLLATEATLNAQALYLASKATLLLDFTLAGVTHQYGFRALFQQGHVGDVFFTVMAVAAYSLSAVLRPRRA